MKMHIKLFALVLGIGLMSLGLWAESDYTGPKACAECHELEYKAWQESHHFTSYRDLSGSALAKSMKDALNITRLKTDERCMSCHFMSKSKGDKEKAVSGPNCESCHGAAEGWINVHGDFGGKSIKKEEESSEHRQKRWSESEKQGLIRPKHRVQIVKNCLSCHIVNRADVVNGSEHPARSDFEWVAWFSGEVNHRVWYNDGAKNAPLPQEAKRHYYVLGQLLDGALTLRALAQSGDGAFGKTHRDHFESLKPRIARLSQIGVNVPDLNIDLQDKGAVKALADALEKQAKGVTSDAANKDAVDAWLPKPKDYQGDLWEP